MKTTQNSGLGIVAICGLLIGLCASGCWDRSQPAVSQPTTVEPTAAAPQTPLRILIVDDQPLGDAIQKQWQAADGAPIEIQHRTAEQMVDRDQPLPPTDVLIYPNELLGEFVERDLLLPLPDESLSAASYNRREIFELVRQRECVWGEWQFAVPFGSPQFVLLYRADIFEQKQLSPPKTWLEYQQLVKKLAGELSKDRSQKMAQMFATLEPSAAPWRAKLLLARAAAAVRHRNQFSDLFDYGTMQPLIDQPPFVRALEEMVATAKSSVAGGSDATSDWRRAALSPADVFDRLRFGQTAMAITWPQRGVGRDPEDEPSVSLPIQIAPLPGADDVFNFRESQWEKNAGGEVRHVPLLSSSGRVGSVAKETRRARAALNLLTMLTGPDWSSRVASQSLATSIFRESHLGHVGAWLNSPAFDASAAQRFGTVLRETQSSSQWMFSPRLPGQHEYLAALDQAIAAAHHGTSAAEALKQCAQQWQAITDRRGVETQRKAYRRSLGLEL